MLPAINVLNYNPPTSLVATTMPDAIAVRAPYDNVAPSVSSPQLNNNASPNNEVVPATAEDVQAAAAASETSSFTLPSNAQAIANSGSQAAFLAQLIEQDGSPTAQNVLVQYEKLVNFSLVKYKPSDAGRPQADPAATFEKVFQSLHTTSSPAPTTVSAPIRQPQVQLQNTAPQVEAEAPVVAVEAPAPRPAKAPQDNAPAASTFTTAAISAYTATVQRNNAPANNNDALNLEVA